MSKHILNSEVSLQSFIGTTRELLSYDPESGILTWRVSRGRVSAGHVAGYAAHNGYSGIRIDGRCYYAHRVIFAWMTGRSPEFVDHINGARSDNRWVNLREVTRSENGMNMKVPSTNKSGVIGVFWNKGKGKWTAKIKRQQRTTNLGHFERLSDAVSARREAEKRLGFHENHGRPA